MLTISTDPLKHVHFRISYLVAWLCLLTAEPASASDGRLMVKVDGKTASVSADGTASVASDARDVSVRYEADPQDSRHARVRFRLDGVDERWRDGQGESFVTVRFLDARGDQLAQTAFKVTGESSGWRASLHESIFTHRREVVTVPAGAVTFWIVISSAGPPPTQGVYGIKGVTVSELPENGDGVPVPLGMHTISPATVEAEHSPFWVRDGSKRGMAKLIEIDDARHAWALEIRDDDATAHAEWHTSRDAAPRLNGAKAILLEWDEAYSIGISDALQASYSSLAPGRYTFRVQHTDTEGVPNGEQMRLVLTVHGPVWQSSWFWVALASAVTAASVGSIRYSGWRRMRAEIAAFKQERALDHERLRIAQDIHDDLGARVTHISLISAMKGEQATDLEQARATFEQISGLTRDLVFALYQTVWAVNPDNDSLEALVDHLCQIAGKQCAAANLRCRLYIDPFPMPLAVSSEARHHISMAVSEALHNAVKHAQAEEISLTIKMPGDVLQITVGDNGKGLDLSSVELGNGLSNMRSRMDRIHGTVVVAPSEQGGTQVNFSIPRVRLTGTEKKH